MGFFFKKKAISFLFFEFPFLFFSYNYFSPLRPKFGLLFRISHKPLAGSLRVLHAPAKINNLGTDEFDSNPPFSKKMSRHFHFAQVTFGGNDGFKKIENLEFLKKF